VRRKVSRDDIKELRALAMLAVVGCQYFSGYFPGGYFGVDPFFVISGVLITGVILRSTRAGEFSPAYFYARRVSRLLPAMLPMLAASVSLP
jgi:peptidoglycan/LPS O-acetylase OafA/YrhL